MRIFSAFYKYWGRHKHVTDILFRICEGAKEKKKETLAFSVQKSKCKEERYMKFYKSKNIQVLKFI